MLQSRILVAAALLLSSEFAWAGQAGPAATATAFPARAEFGRTVALLGDAANFSAGAVEYRWTQLDLDTTPAVQLSGATGRVATFTAPAQAVSLRFQFTATAAFQAASATVMVEVAGSDPMAGEASGLTICPQAGNQPAVATVPAGVTVESGSEVSIAATDADDPDDTGGLSDVVFAWTVLEGRGALSDDDLSGAETPAVGFAAPDFATDAVLALTVTVNDSAGCGNRYSVAVLVTPALPRLTASVTARIGEQDLPSGDRVVSGETIRLLPGAGYSPEPAGPSAFAFSWRQVEGPEVELTIDEAGAEFTVPEVEADSAIAFELTAVDGAESARAVLSLVASPPELYFSQVAFGPVRNQALRTVLVLINDRDVAAGEVGLQFFDFNGDPLPLGVDGMPPDPSEAVLAIGAGASRQITLEGPAGVTTVGWGRVRSNVRLTGLVLYQLLDLGTSTLDSEVSLFSSPRAGRFTTFFGRSDGLAFAVANPGATDTEVNVRVLDGGMNPGEVASMSLMLPGGRQLARFLDATFFGADFPAGFEAGTVIVESYDAPAILTVLKTDATGLPFSTLPVSTRPTAMRPPPPNDPPNARLLFRIGSSGPFLEPDPGVPVSVASPAEITLDAGLSGDPEGGQLTFTFNLETSLTAGGASLRNVNPSLRILDIVEGTLGTVRVTATVTDPGGLTDSASILFSLP